MDGSPKSRETLFVCHVSEAHGQSVGWHLYSSVQTPRRPRSLNLTHSISLPERGNLPREALENGSPYYTSKSSSTETSDQKGSENSSRYELSPMLQRFTGLSENSLLTSPPRTTKSLPRRGETRWQNLFIPESEVIEDEEDEDSDGDNLHKYHEGSSLQLHGSFTVSQSINTGNSTECRAGASVYSQEILNYVMSPVSKAIEIKENERESYPGCEDSKETPITFMDCNEQDWVDEEVYNKHTLEELDNSSVQTDNLLNSESLTQNPTDYITDSSCNSSDGVLVNFSAIYNKTNNAVPATPLNLDSPVYQSGTALQDASNPMPSWSSCSVDPNSNIYPHDSDNFSSMEITDLAMCLQSQARLAGSTQNYYKLVTCDLSSQSSPSPPWSSLTSFSETHSQGSCSPPSEYFLFEPSEGKENKRPKVNQSEPKENWQTEVKNTTRDTRNQFRGTTEKMAHAETNDSTTIISDYKSCNYIQTPQSQRWIGSENISTLSRQGALQNSCPSRLDTNVSSPRSRQHATSFAEIARCKKGNGDLSCMKQSAEGPSTLYSCNLSSIQKDNASEQNTILFNPKSNDTVTVHSLCTDSRNQSNPEGECSSSPGVVRYTKAQRPTSLPIQPFVLQAPSGKQQNKTLGSLFNQYISHKYTKPGPSKATCKSKERPHHIQSSPLGGYSTILLEAATSSDTCSTCTASPVLSYSCSKCSLLGRIHQTLMNRSPDMSTKTRQRSPHSPEQTEGSPKACSSQTHSWTGKQAFSVSITSTNQDPTYSPEQVYLVQNPPVIEELLATGPQNASHPSQHGSSPAITSVTSLTSITSLITLPGTGRRSLWPFEADSQVCTNEGLSNNICNYFGPRRPLCVKKGHQHGDSFSMTDRPPEEFCLSPEAPSEPLSFDLLHKKRMLKAVSLAVDLITVHFSSRQELEEKIRLGNSSICPSISQLVFKHLCPAIQNILQDGLKAYKLDFIIGQRPNKLWNVIEATARPGSSARMPDSLVSVVKKCTQLSHSMRLYVFIMDLLNLRALKFWIGYLYSCVDIVEDHYHPWGFLALAQGSTYGPLFQELLLLLHPLSLLSFESDLPSEAHLQSNQKQNQRAPHRLLAQSAQILQMSSVQKNRRSPTGQSDSSSNKITSGYWLNQIPTSECESVVCCSDSTHKKEEFAMENGMMPGSSSRSQEDKSLSVPRWARLFGSVGGTPVGPKSAQKNISGTLRRQPSEWLKIGASKVDLLAQSVWTGKWSETPLRLNHDKHTTNTEHMLNLY